VSRRVRVCRWAMAASAASATVNVALALTLMPVSLCLGFTAATISFTAWNIVVPLLLNGFGLPLAPTGPPLPPRGPAIALRGAQTVTARHVGEGWGDTQCSSRSCWTCATARC
jgi:hypothetical protein